MILSVYVKYEKKRDGKEVFLEELISACNLYNEWGKDHNNFKNELSNLMANSLKNDFGHKLFISSNAGSSAQDKCCLLAFLYFIHTNCTIMFVLRFE